MQALTLTSFGGPDALGFANLTEPVVGPGQSAVSVRAVALGPWDLRATEGYFVAIGGSSVFPQVQGWDFAGETDDGAGPWVLSPSPGWVSGPWRSGSWSPHKCWPNYLTSSDGRTPAALPVCSLAARLLVEGARLSNGDMVVVTGAAGMVGGFAVQLARAEGARVIAAVRGSEAEEARRLGSDVVVSTGPDMADLVRGLHPSGADACLDTLGLGAPALEGVRPGGRFLTRSRRRCRSQPETSHLKPFKCSLTRGPSETWPGAPLGENLPCV